MIISLSYHILVGGHLIILLWSKINVDVNDQTPVKPDRPEAYSRTGLTYAKNPFLNIGTLYSSKHLKNERQYLSME